MENLPVNGISMSFERHGKGASLLLVHGFPLDHSTWLALSPYLESDFDVIMPDLRGFGRSGAPDGDFSLDQMAADLAALLDGLHIGQAYVAGHSMGGYISLAFARSFPQRLSGLGLVGSQVAPDSPESKAKRYATAEQVKLQGATAVLGMAEKLSANPDHLPFFREVILRQSTAGVMAALHAMAERPDSSSLLAALKVPVVLIHGLADALIPPERSREMKALLPAAQLVELPGTGHSAAFEAPFETAEALQRLAAA